METPVLMCNWPILLWLTGNFFIFIAFTTCTLWPATIYGHFSKLCALRLSVRTPGFQPGKRGSIPLGRTISFSRTVKSGEGAHEVFASPSCIV